MPEKCERNRCTWVKEQLTVGFPNGTLDALLTLPGTKHFHFSSDEVFEEHLSYRFCHSGTLGGTGREGGARYQSINKKTSLNNQYTQNILIKRKKKLVSTRHSEEARLPARCWGEGVLLSVAWTTPAAPLCCVVIFLLIVFFVFRVLVVFFDFITCLFWFVL